MFLILLALRRFYNWIFWSESYFTGKYYYKVLSNTGLNFISLSVLIYFLPSCYPLFSAIYIFVAHLDWSYCDQEQESWENNRIKWWVFKSSGTNRTNPCPCYVGEWNIFVACLSNNCRSTWQNNFLKHKRDVNTYLNIIFRHCLPAQVTHSYIPAVFARLQVRLAPGNHLYKMPWKLPFSH